MLVATWKIPQEHPWIAPAVQRNLQRMTNRLWRIDLWVLKDEHKYTSELRPRERYNLSDLVVYAGVQLNLLIAEHGNDVEGAGFKLYLLR